VIQRWKLRQLRTSLGALRAAVDVDVVSSEGAGGVAKQIDANQPTLRCVSGTERGEGVKDGEVLRAAFASSIQALARKALAHLHLIDWRDAFHDWHVAGGRIWVLTVRTDEAAVVRKHSPVVNVVVLRANKQIKREVSACVAHRSSVPPKAVGL
jgi:hypothetical protein